VRKAYFEEGDARITDGVLRKVSYSFGTRYLVLLLHLTELCGWLALA